MDIRNYKKMNLLDLVNIERAKKDTIYESGNIIIQVSASKGQIFYLDKDTQVESKYIILKTKDKNKINSKYLYYIISQHIENFLKKYQTDINIQPDVFKYMELDIHIDIEMQNKITDILDKMEERISFEEKNVEMCEDLKKWHLEKMFV